MSLLKKKYFSGRRLFIARVNKGIAAADLAKKVDITEEHLINIEQERSKPSIRTLIALANVLELKLEVLFE